MKKADRFKNQTEFILDKLENYSHIPIKYLQFTQADYNNLMLHIKTYFLVSIFAVTFSNILHLILASISPQVYVNISSYSFIFLFFSLSAIINFFLIRANRLIENAKLRYFLAFIGFISAIISILLFFFIHKYNQSSILLIKASSSLINKHPFLLLLALIQSALLFIMNALFTIIITLSFTPIWPIRHIVTLILYILFSYYWIASTLYYVCYMTISGVTKYEYQVHLQQVNWASISSFWKVITSQFNNAVFAGLALTMIQFKKHSAAKKRPRLHNFVKHRNKFIRYLVWILEVPGFVMSYVFTFIYSIVECILKDITSNALIYCMIYNCSYKEGTAKWMKENVEERIDKINQNVMIKNILYCHRIIFTVLALFCASFSLYFYEQKFEIIDFIITLLLTLILMHSTFSILGTLIKTTSETLFICFTEIPEKMNEKFKNLYSTIVM